MGLGYAVDFAVRNVTCIALGLHAADAGSAPPFHALLLSQATIAAAFLADGTSDHDRSWPQQVDLAFLREHSILACNITSCNAAANQWVWQHDLLPSETYYIMMMPAVWDVTGKPNQEVLTVAQGFQAGKS